MHKFVKRTMKKKCYDINSDIYVFIADKIKTNQPQATLAMLLFNRQSRGLLLRLSRPPILCDNDGNNHTALANRQSQSNKEADTHVNIYFLPMGSTVVVQQEDGGPLMHGTIIGDGAKDHSVRCFKIRVTKTRYIISWNPTTCNSHLRIHKELS